MADDRQSAQLIASDGVSVLASFEQYTEEMNDFILTIGSTTSSSYDPVLVFLSFGVWAFSEEKGVVDMCYIIKKTTLVGTILFGIFTIFIVAVTIAGCHHKRKKSKEPKMEV